MKIMGAINIVRHLPLQFHKIGSGIPMTNRRKQVAMNVRLMRMDNESISHKKPDDPIDDSKRPPI